MKTETKTTTRKMKMRSDSLELVYNQVLTAIEEGWRVLKPISITIGFKGVIPVKNYTATLIHNVTETTETEGTE